jgi:hypothetical protein
MSVKGLQAVPWKKVSNRGNTSVCHKEQRHFVEQVPMLHAPLDAEAISKPRLMD